MKLARKVLSTLAVLGVLAGTAAAQDGDKEATKRKILQEVERRLDQERDRVLKEIERIIDEELARSKKGPAEPPKAVAPKAEAPRIEAPKIEAPKPAPPAPARKVRGYLGVKSSDLTEDEKKALGVRAGVRIEEVLADSPAAKAGLRAEDILTTLNGKDIPTYQDLGAMIQDLGAGATVKLEILRAGKKQEISATLARRPDEPEAEPAPAPRKEDPSAQAPELRERVKKFMEQEKAQPKAEPPRKAEPAPKPKPAPEQDDALALDDELIEQARPLLEQLGMEPEQFFERGDDGKWRLVEPYNEYLKGLDLKRFMGEFEKLFKSFRGEEEAPKPAPPKPKPAPPKPAPPPAPAVSRPWLGIQVEGLSEELRAQLDLPEGSGLLVGEVVPGSPAENAGLKKNDILLKLDGKPVQGQETLDEFMGAAKIGQEVTVVVLRKAKEQTFKVTLGERKE